MSLPVRRPGRALALLKAKARATANPANPSWPLRLAADLRELDADWRESAEVCADAAWAARVAGHSVLSLLSLDQVTAAGSDPVTARTYRHLYLSSLRYDFRCPTLQLVVEQLPSAVRAGLDCCSRALYVFALLGQSRPEGLDLMDEVLLEAGDHGKTLHVLLHGLWLGQDLDQGAERLLALSSRPPFDTGTDPIALFRVAGALHRLGRYDEALAAIDRALDRLPPGDAAVHADLVRERSLIAAARDARWHRCARALEGTPA
ncbi:tol-pal system YbgF family protein [Streptomyces sp. NPDC058084]|uniref:tetratricopeptide repeat protein n=1 Tax=Streptomyces sp. NPDC058084 TaxID=3346333 RepID=UPI0036E4B05C